MIEEIWKDILYPEVKRLRRLSKLWWNKQTPMSLVKCITTTVVLSLIFYMGIVVLFV